MIPAFVLSLEKSQFSFRFGGKFIVVPGEKTWTIKNPCLGHPAKLKTLEKKPALLSIHFAGHVALESKKQCLPALNNF